MDIIQFHAVPYGNIRGPISTLQINASPYAIIQFLCKLDGYVELSELI